MFPSSLYSLEMLLSDGDATRHTAARCPLRRDLHSWDLSSDLLQSHPQPHQCDKALTQRGKLFHAKTRHGLSSAIRGIISHQFKFWKILWDISQPLLPPDQSHSQLHKEHLRSRSLFLLVSYFVRCSKANHWHPKNTHQ